MEKGPLRFRRDPQSNSEKSGWTYIAFATLLVAFDAALAALSAAFIAAFIALSAAFDAFSAELAALLAAFSAPPEQAARPSEAARTSERAIDLVMGRNPSLRIKTVQTTLGEKLTPHCACASIRNALDDARQSHSCDLGRKAGRFCSQLRKFCGH